MRANRTDTNHKEIVAKFRSLGFFVHDISALKNCCDLVVTKGLTAYIEVKDGQRVPSERKLTDGEIKFRDDVLAKGGMWYLVESEIDVEKVYLKFNSYERKEN